MAPAQSTSPLPGGATVESPSRWGVEVSKVYDVVAPAFPLRSDAPWVVRSW
jgi:hypothetical protein